MSPRPWRGDSPDAVHQLRSRWQTASLASGWPFPDDWRSAEVDLVCETVLADLDPIPALTRLSRARARAGCGLAETLQDLAALHAVLTVPALHDGLIAADPDVVPAGLIRVTALAWADVLVRQLAHAEVADSLTGLSSVAYLRARLREVYRESTAAGVPTRSKYVLIVVAPDLRHTVGWSRLAAMVLLSDVLSSVFHGGQTLAVLGSGTIGVLAPRDAELSGSVATVRLLAAARLAVDPQLHRVGVPPVWLERLPDGHHAACQLLGDLGRL
jgi:hypothetical protein